MKLNPNDPRLGPFVNWTQFKSPFPTTSGYQDSQVQELLDKVPIDPRFATMGQALLAQKGAEAWQLAQGLCNKQIMTVLGDFPRDWLPDTAWMKQTGMVSVAQGLFAAVAFPSVENTRKFTDALIDVGLDVALKAINAVPIYGWIARAVISFGRTLFNIWTTRELEPLQRRYQLPWKSYSRDIDEDLINFSLLPACQTVDWTDVFSPSTAAAPWTLAEGVEDGQVVGKIFAPIKLVNNKEQVNWTTGLGVLPCSVQVAGIIQTRPVYTPNNPRLVRYFTDGQAIPWAPLLTQTGDFQPALAQAGGQLWQQAQKAGSPDMYKIDVLALATRWQAWFAEFFDSVWALAADDEWLGDLAAPYIVVKRADVQLGMPWRTRPQPAPIVWPGIFDQGPARPEARNLCLFADVKNKQIIRPGESPLSFWWPWHTEPEQAAMAPPYKVVNGHRVSDGPAVAKPPSNWRCYVWPSGEELLSGYGRPFEDMVLPALQRLRDLQWGCGAKTLVCAHVRIDNGPAGPRYAAFADPLLRSRFFDLRKQLLVSPDRFLVSYQDAKMIDPEYAQALADAGVPTTEVARKAMFLKLAGAPGGPPPGEVDPVAPPLPPPLPPMGGVAFGRPEDDTPPPSGGGGSGAGALLAGAAALALYLKLRK